MKYYSYTCFGVLKNGNLLHKWCLVETQLLRTVTKWYLSEYLSPTLETSKNSFSSDSCKLWTGLQIVLFIFQKFLPFHFSYNRKNLLETKTTFHISFLRSSFLFIPILYILVCSSKPQSYNTKPISMTPHLRSLCIAQY